MLDKMNNFWQKLQSQDYSSAQEDFDTFDPDTKQNILAELHQKSAFSRKPFVISALRGELHQDKKFSDFYRAWLPDAEACNKVKQNGQIFHQGFKLPVRVLNAVNITNPEEIISIGLTWANSQEEENGFWQYLEEVKKGENSDNENRHGKIKKVIDRELLGLFKVKSDDNLGTPF